MKLLKFLLLTVFCVSWKICSPHTDGFWSLSSRKFEDIGEAMRFVEHLFINPDVKEVKIACTSSN